MKSLFHLLRDYPALRIYSIRSGLAFGAFLAMWSCLAFKMGNAPFYADSDVIGGLGLCGIAGALTASFVGKYVKRVGIRNFNFIGCSLILSAWLHCIGAETVMPVSLPESCLSTSVCNVSNSAIKPVSLNCVPRPPIVSIPFS